jgi:hypothetical protein
MTIARWSTASEEITERIAFRLRAGASATTRQVLWERDDRRLLLQLSSLLVSIKDGWLLVNLSVQTEPTGPRLLQFVFFLGSDGEGDGTQAGGTIHTDSREGAQLAQLWGDDLQRAIWDGVLDIVEGSLTLAERSHPGLPLDLLGFSCSAGQLNVDIQAVGGA